MYACVIEDFVQQLNRASFVFQLPEDVAYHLFCNCIEAAQLYYVRVLKRTWRLANHDHRIGDVNLGKESLHVFREITIERNEGVLNISRPRKVKYASVLIDRMAKAIVPGAVYLQCIKNGSALTVMSLSLGKQFGDRNVYNLHVLLKILKPSAKSLKRYRFHFFHSLSFYKAIRDYTDAASHKYARPAPAFRPNKKPPGSGGTGRRAAQGERSGEWTAFGGTRVRGDDSPSARPGASRRLRAWTVRGGNRAPPCYAGAGCYSLRSPSHEKPCLGPSGNAP